MPVSTARTGAGTATSSGSSLALAQLSDRLTEAITSVEQQRSQLEDVLAHLTQQAATLTAVSSVLTDATHAQGTVLAALQHLLQSGDAPPQLSSALQPAMNGLAAAAGDAVRRAVGGEHLGRLRG